MIENRMELNKWGLYAIKLQNYLIAKDVIFAFENQNDNQN